MTEPSERHLVVQRNGEMMPSLLKKVSATQNRRGFVLVVAIVCLVLIAAILGTLLQLGVSVSRQALRDGRRVQADWLADSALDRAAHQLRSDADYTGETWRISAEELGGPDSGQVQITVSKSQDAPQQRVVSVQAKFPAEGTHSVQRTRTTTVPLDAGDG